ncbi:isomerase/hydrolase [Oceanicoccus sagamiensis]|uniref:Isomerase/hydrolase n=1 Tax=Oceanicoccus sagamiensis TaxID=716816 RepID=A0A1X9NDS8_9GAMM|nr:isomerase/hydrolase [Oceanicoccus sagamiensis]
MYRHQLAAAVDCTDQLGKIICVGRNYADHAKELNNPIPDQPLLFIKPATAAVSMHRPVSIPDGLGACHHELEMAVLIGQPLTAATAQQVAHGIAGIGLGLDLTLRDIQDTLKQKSQPWERAKAFDGACPLSTFVAVDGVDLQALDIQLAINGELKQCGNTRDMLFSTRVLLQEISQSFTLLPGDVVLTGTPAGVGPLHHGDQLVASLGDLITVNTQVMLAD